MRVELSVFFSAILVLTVGFGLPAAPDDGSTDESVSDIVAEVLSTRSAFDGAEAEVVSVQSESISLVPVGAESGQSVDIVLPKSDFIKTGTQSSQAIEGSAGGFATLTADTADGLAVITVDLEGTARVPLEYEISGVSDPYLVGLPGGGFVVLDANDEYVIDLAAPWAVDAKGKSLETEYVLENNVLTQSVRYANDTAFPVVSDPKWSYAYDTASFNLVTGKEKASPARVLKELRRCFNCSFPVGGAPKSFPALNQRIDLTASFLWITQPAPVRVSTIASNGFTFTALGGHFDGAGSTIAFTFYNDRSGWLHLKINATVVKDQGAAANAANAAVAKSKWDSFLANLIRQRTL